MKKLIIKNKKHQKLSALYHKGNSEKIIIFTHSFKGDKNYQPIIKEFSEQIQAKGYSVLRFDCYGSGDSDGSFEESSIYTQISDLKDIVKYSKNVLGYKKICLSGISMGTSISIEAYTPEINCMLFWSPVFRHHHLYDAYKNDIVKNGFIIRERKLTGEKVKCGKDMWESFNSVKPYEKLDQITCPTLIILGENDTHLPLKKAKEFIQQISGKTNFELIKNGDHDFLVESAKNEAIRLSIQFIINNY